MIILVLNATNVYMTPDGDYAAKSSSAAVAEIAMIFIFGFVVSAGWTPNQAMYPVECLRYEARAKGMGMYNVSSSFSSLETKITNLGKFFVNVAGFYNTFVTGIAFTNAGWKYYFLFIFWDILECIVIYFLFVETKGRTLEELTEIFQARNPVKRSLQQTDVMIHDGVMTEILNKIW